MVFDVLITILFSTLTFLLGFLPSLENLPGAFVNGWETGVAFIGNIFYTVPSAVDFIPLITTLIVFEGAIILWKLIKQTISWVRG